MRTIFLLTALLIATLAAAAHHQKSLTKTALESFDLDKYMGDWFEIARFDNRFERNLECVVARYTLQDDGAIAVRNSGYNTLKGEWQSSHGRAKTTPIAGRLKVSFFWIAYSQYNVLAVGEGEGRYTWALVGSSSSKYLWILAREPKLDTTTMRKIINQAQARGYDTSKLLYVDQECWGGSGEK